MSRWRKDHPGQETPDGHISTQPWPAGPAESRRDQIIYYQYKADRARRTLHGIDEQAAKAVAGQAPVKRNRFIKLDGAAKSVNHALEAKARDTGRSTRKFVKTARHYRTIEIQADRQIITATDPLPNDPRQALDAINHHN